MRNPDMMKSSLILMAFAGLIFTLIVGSCNKQLPVTIVPGSRIHNVHMGETIDSVMSKLGEPQLGDAAMGHAWGTWLDTVKITRQDTVVHRMDVYFVVSGEYLGGLKTVHQIRTNNPNEYTAQRIHVGSKLDEIRRVYPGISRSSWRSYKKTDDKSDSVITYDAVSRGIAFDMVNSTKTDAAGRIYKVCNAIIVHIPDQYANEVYLPLFSDEKSLLRGRGSRDSLDSFTGINK